MVTPADISQKRFATTRLKEGYDQEEVDEFLDRVEATLRSTLEDGERTSRQLDTVNRKLESLTSEASTTVLPLTPTGSAEKILIAAQKTADLMEAEANAEAGQIRAAARAEADSLRNAAEAERQQILNKLQAERTALEEGIEILKSKRVEYKAWLRATLARIEEEEATGA